MLLAFTILPSWDDLRGNLWNDLIVSAVPFLAWLFTRYKGLSAQWQTAWFITGEVVLAVAGLTAVSRFGAVAVAPSLTVLVLPLLLLYWLEKRGRAIGPESVAAPDQLPVGPVITVSAFASSMDLYEGPETVSSAFLQAYMRPYLAVLEVTNDGITTITDLTAQVQWEDWKKTKGLGTWSRSSGPRFVLGGQHKADITPGDSRLLAVALAYESDAQWARLPFGSLPEQPFKIVSPRPIRYIDTRGQDTTIGENGRAVVTLSADRLKVVEHIRLGFREEPPLGKRAVVESYDPKKRDATLEDPANTPITNPESIEQLRSLREPCLRATRYAFEYLHADIILPGINGSDEGKRIIAGLLSRYFLPQAERANDDLEQRLSALSDRTTRKDLAEIIDDFDRVFGLYIHSVRWATIVGGFFFSKETLLASEGYGGLYRRHQECLRKLRDIRHRGDIGHVADSLADLTDLLPDAPKAQFQVSNQVPPTERASQAVSARLNLTFVVDDHFSGSKENFPAVSFAPGEVPIAVGFLVVHNVGASTVKCRARVSVHSGIVDWPSGEILAAWYHHNSDEIEIEPGFDGRIIVAVLLKAQWTFYRWSVPYWFKGKASGAATASLIGSNQDLRADITITVMSDPPPTDGLPIRHLVLEGDKVHEAT